uniref:Uncharacterized protein n=1 Tax=Amphimedon queenslandica TaxID=400682 RepID=A0A1X7SZL0_AMPQE
QKSNVAAKMDYKKLDLDDVSMLVQECLKKLEEMERLLLHEDLTKNKKSLEAEKAQLSEQVERLKTKKKGMEEKISFGDYTIQPKLLQTQQHYQKYDAGTQRIKVSSSLLYSRIGK